MGPRNYDEADDDMAEKSKNLEQEEEESLDIFASPAMEVNPSDSAGGESRSILDDSARYIIVKFQIFLGQ